MIQIQNVTKKFGDRVLFSGLSTEIEDGEFVVFSGVSGCGKTTLLNMIGGLERFSEGQILVDGMDIRKRKNLLKFYRGTVGFLFQNFALMENKTVLQNLEIVKAGCRSKTSPAQALEAVGLSGKETAKVYTLSGGEQQRLALARLMVKQCSLILADEPTGSLDKGNARAVMEILKKLNSDGKTVVLVTHDEELKLQGNKIVELS